MSQLMAPPDIFAGLPSFEEVAQSLAPQQQPQQAQQPAQQPAQQMGALPGMEGLPSEQEVLASLQQSPQANGQPQQPILGAPQQPGLIPPQAQQPAPDHNQTIDQILSGSPDPVKAADNLLSSGALKDSPQSEAYVKLFRAKQRYRESGAKEREGEHAWITSRIPFVGGMKTMVDMAYVIPALNRVREGKGTDQDYNEIALYQLQQEYLGDRTGFGQKVMDVITQLPAFGVEFGMSGGVASAGRQAVKYGLGRAAYVAARRESEKMAAEFAAKGLAGKVLSKAADAFGAQAIAQTAAAPTITGAALAKQAMPDMSQEEGKTGLPELKIGDQKSWGTVALKGFLDSYITHASERSGEVFGELGGVGAKSINPKMLDSLPIGDGLKKFIIQKYLNTPGIKPNSIFNKLRDVGYHGMLNEMLEERVDEIARGATGLEKDYGTSGDIAAGRFKKAGEQLAVEAAAFAVPGAAGAAYDRLNGQPGSAPLPAASAPRPPAGTPPPPPPPPAGTAPPPGGGGTAAPGAAPPPGTGTEPPTPPTEEQAAPPTQGEPAKGAARSEAEWLAAGYYVTDKGTVMDSLTGQEFNKADAPEKAPSIYSVPKAPPPPEQKPAQPGVVQTPELEPRPEEKPRENKVAEGGTNVGISTTPPAEPPLDKSQPPTGEPEEKPAEPTGDVGNFTRENLRTHLGDRAGNIDWDEKTRTWKVHTPDNSRFFEIQLSDKPIELTEGRKQKIMQTYGYSPEQAEAVRLAGAYSVKHAEGQGPNGLGLIQIYHNVGLDILDHEMVHMAHNMGMFTPAEWGSLVQKYSKSDRTVSQQGEDIAQALYPSASRPNPELAQDRKGLLDRIGDFVQRMARGLGIHSLLGLTPEQIKGAEELTGTKAFWMREPAPHEVAFQKQLPNAKAVRVLVDGERKRVTLKKKGDLGDINPATVTHLISGSQKVIWTHPDENPSTKAGKKAIKKIQGTEKAQETKNRDKEELTIYRAASAHKVDPDELRQAVDDRISMESEWWQTLKEIVKDHPIQVQHRQALANGADENSPALRSLRLDELRGSIEHGDLSGRGVTFDQAWDAIRNGMPMEPSAQNADFVDEVAAELARTQDDRQAPAEVEKSDVGNEPLEGEGEGGFNPADFGEPAAPKTKTDAEIAQDMLDEMNGTKTERSPQPPPPKTPPQAPQTSKPPVAPPRAPTQQEIAKKQMEDFGEEFAELVSEETREPVLDQAKAKAAVNVTMAAMRAGITTFPAYVQFAESNIGAEKTAKAMPYLRKAWAAASRLPEFKDKIDPAIPAEQATPPAATPPADESWRSVAALGEKLTKFMRDIGYDPATDSETIDRWMKTQGVPEDLRDAVMSAAKPPAPREQPPQPKTETAPEPAGGELTDDDLRKLVKDRGIVISRNQFTWKYTAYNGRDARGKKFKENVEAFGVAVPQNQRKYDRGTRTWIYEPEAGDPTLAIARALVRLGYGPANTKRSDGGVGSRLRRVKFEATDRRRSASDYDKLVDPETKHLIRLGARTGISDEVLNEQIEDVGKVIAAWEDKVPMFLIGNAPGSGKTYLLGATIRELRARGETKFVYITNNQDLIKQVKANLAPYKIGDVVFTTYTEIRDKLPDAENAVVIFDEAHLIKNEDSEQGEAGAKMMPIAKFRIFASATPYENPLEVRYIEKTGLFDGLEITTEPTNKKKKGIKLDGFAAWAYSFGADVAGRKEIGWRISWQGGREKNELLKLSREWLLKSGAFSQRPIKLNPGMVSSPLTAVAVSKEWVDKYNAVNRAYEWAKSAYPADALGLAKHAMNLKKRMLEASKISHLIKKAKRLVAEGKQVVIFTETKADRWLGKFRKSNSKANSPLYEWPEIERMDREWKMEVARLRPGEDRPPRPFAGFIVAIAHAFDNAGIKYLLPGVPGEVVRAFPKGQVSQFHGGQRTKANDTGLNMWKAGKTPVLVATMAKGGTGMSLHDTTGKMPDRHQLVANLPWKGTGVEQVGGRLPRYGIVRPVVVEWFFANNIPIEEELAMRVGQRMQAMGAIVSGVDVQAGKDIEDFNFEDEEWKPTPKGAEPPKPPTGTSVASAAEEPREPEPTKTRAEIVPPEAAKKQILGNQQEKLFDGGAAKNPTLFGDIEIPKKQSTVLPKTTVSPNDVTIKQPTIEGQLPLIPDVTSESRAPRERQADDSHVLKTLHDLSERPGQGDLIFARDIREATNLPKEKLDKQLVQLASEGIISLHRTDSPQFLSDDVLATLIHNPDFDPDNHGATWFNRNGSALKGSYYVGATIRSTPIEPSEAAPQPGAGSYSPPIAAAAPGGTGTYGPPTGKGISANDIRTTIDKWFGVPILRGRVRNRGKGKTLGYYSWLKGIIRVINPEWANLGVITHELGHALDDQTDIVKAMPLNVVMEVSRLDYDPTRMSVQEGWAEFLRHYFTTGLAGNLAPQTLAYFQKWQAANAAQAKQDPKIRNYYRRFMQLGSLMQQFINQNPQDAVLADHWQNGRQGEVLLQDRLEVFREKAGSVWEGLKNAMFDETRVLKQVVQVARGIGSHAALTFERMLDQLHGTDNTRASNAIMNGVHTLSDNPQKLSDGLPEILKEIESSEFDALDAYLDSVDAIARMDRAPNYNPGKARAVYENVIADINKDPGKAARFEKAAKGLRKFSEALVMLAVHEHILTPEAGARMIASQEHFYMPRYRKREYGMVGKAAKWVANTSKSMLPLKSPFRRMSPVGSSDAYMPAIEAYMRQAYETYNSAVKYAIMVPFFKHTIPEFGGAKGLGDLVTLADAKNVMERVSLEKLLDGLTKEKIVGMVVRPPLITPDEAQLIKDVSGLRQGDTNPKLLDRLEAIYGTRDVHALTALSLDVWDMADKIAFWTRDFSSSPNEHIVRVVMDGKTYLVQFRQDYVYKALMGMRHPADATAFSKFWVGIINGWNNVFTKPMKALSVGLNPATVLKLAAIDAPSFMLNSKHTGYVERYYAPFMGIGWMIGAKLKQMSGDKLPSGFKEFAAVGAVMDQWQDEQSAKISAHRYGTPQQTTRSLIKKIFARTPAEKRWATWRYDAPNAVKDMMGSLDSGMRLAESMAAIRGMGYKPNSGISQADLEAQRNRWFDPHGNLIDSLPEEVSAVGASAGNEVLTNFKKKGYVGREVDKVTPFFTAGIAGMVKELHNVGEIATGKGQAWGERATAAAVLAALAAGYWWVTQDDDDRIDMDPEIANRFWTFSVEGVPWLKIPKPRGYGFIPNLVEGMLDLVVKGKNPHLWEKIRAEYESIKPPLGPAGVSTALEVALNRDWTGRKIEDDSQEHLARYLRSKPYTLEISKTMGKMFQWVPDWLGGGQMSPAKIEYVLDQYTGGFYSGVAGTTERAIRGEIEVRNLPLVKKFETRGLYQRSIREFYDKANELEQNVATDKFLNNVDPIRVEHLREMNRYRSILADIRKATVDVSNLDKKLDLDRYGVGLADYVLGKPPRESFPNPLAKSTKNAPPVVVEARTEYLGKMGHALTHSVKQRVGEGFASYRDRFMEVAAERRFAQDELKRLGYSSGDVEFELAKKLYKRHQFLSPTSRNEIRAGMSLPSPFAQAK